VKANHAKWIAARPPGTLVTVPAVNSTIGIDRKIKPIDRFAILLGWTNFDNDNPKAIFLLDGKIQIISYEDIRLASYKQV
jgi:hypothetical protein